MKNNNIQFWVIVIIIALIAGVIGSIVAKSITGNVITLNKGLSDPSCLSTCLKENDCSSKGKTAVQKNFCSLTCKNKCSEVYTKAEVDAMMSKASTNANVLEMLNKRCYKVNPNPKVNNQCDLTCEAGFRIDKSNTATGVSIGFITVVFYTAIKQDGQKDLEFATMFDFGGVTQPMPNCEPLAGDCSKHIEEFMELETGYKSTTSGISIIGIDSKCICCVP